MASLGTARVPDNRGSTVFSRYCYYTGITQNDTEPLWQTGLKLQLYMEGTSGRLRTVWEVCTIQIRHIRNYRGTLFEQKQGLP